MNATGRTLGAWNTRCAPITRIKDLDILTAKATRPGNCKSQTRQFPSTSTPTEVTEMSHKRPGSTEPSPSTVVGKRYDAFISYSHSGSRSVAEALQLQLERFATPWYRPRRLRVFRDTTNLTAAPDLWARIEQALDASEWFILVASPDAAKSPWVGQEVDWWRRHKPMDHMLIAQTAGTISWRGEDFDWEQTDALPPALAGAFEAEPLWIDLRAIVPRSPQKDEAHSTGTQRVHLGDLVAEFAAPIRHVDKDELVGQHVRELRRTHRTVRSTIAVLLTLLLGAMTAGIVAFNQRNEAVRQRNIAIARSLAVSADENRDQRPDLALQLAMMALQIAPASEARESLANTLAESPFAGIIDRQQSPVHSVAVSKQGLVATGSGDGTVTIWRIGDRSQYTQISKQTTTGGPVMSIDYSPDGTILATGNLVSGTVLWDVSEPAHLRVLGTVPGSAADFGPHNGILCTAEGLWNVSDPRQPSLLAEFPDQQTVRAVDISRDGSVLALASNPATTSMWNISDPRQPVRLSDVPELDDFVAMSADARHLITAPEEGPASIWDISDPGHPLFVSNLSAASNSVVFTAAFSPDGRTVVTAQADGTSIWDLHDPARPGLSRRVHGHVGAVYDVEFTPDGDQLVTGGQDGRAMLWSLASRRSVEQLARIGPFQGAPELLGFRADDRVLVIGGADDPTQIWDVDDARHPTLVSTINADEGGALGISLSADGNMLAESYYDAPPLLWDIRDPSQPALLSSIGDAAGEVSFSPVGPKLARVTESGVIDLWEAEPGRVSKLQTVTRVEPDTYARAVFSSDGHTLAVSTYGETVLWNINTEGPPRRMSTLEGTGVYVEFSPDGHTIVSNGPGIELMLWDASSISQPVKRSSLLGDSSGRDFAFDSTGSVVATGSSSAVASLWNTTDPAAPIRLAEITGHEGSVYNITINHDGEVVATGSYDRTARLWSMPTAASDLGDPVGTACALAGPQMSRQEWNQYIPELPYQRVC